MEISINEVFNKLNNISFFSEFDRKFLYYFISSIELVFFKKGELICKEGAYEATCCIILSGSVGIWNKNNRGKDEKITVLGSGQIFGEIAALSGKPRISTVISEEPSIILYMYKKNLFSLMDSSKKIREIINKHYRERVLWTELKKIGIFENMPDDFFAELIKTVEFTTYHKGEEIVSYGDKSDYFYIIIYGYGKVLIPDSNTTKNKNSNDAKLKISGYLKSGHYFGEMGMMEKVARRATVLATTRLELIKINSDTFQSIFSKYCDVEEIYKKVIANRRRKHIEVSADRVSEGLMDWVVSSDIIQTKTVFIIDLNKCVKCYNCIKACEKLHGSSRLAHKGFRFQNLMIPASCRHCTDPLCLEKCPTGAIVRDFSGEIYHNDYCIGCGNCASRCPFGNISIIHRNEKKNRRYLLLSKKIKKESSRGISIKIIDSRNQDDENVSSRIRDMRQKKSLMIAAKCDNCRDFPYLGCVHNCPRGAAMKVDPRDYFKDLQAVL